MAVAAFLDTNILVYAFSTDLRSERAGQLVAGRNASSVQALNEFANVARRKLGMSWAETREALAILKGLLRPIAPLDLPVHETGIALSARFGFSVFDGLMVAAALSIGCETLWSEDMQNGMVIDGRLTVRNPFVGA